MSHVNLSTVMNAATAVMMRARPLRAVGGVEEEPEKERPPKTIWSYAKQFCRVFALTTLAITTLMAFTLGLVLVFMWASSLPRVWGFAVGILDVAFGFSVIWLFACVLADRER